MADVCFRNRISERWVRRSVKCSSADFEVKLNSKRVVFFNSAGRESRIARRTTINTRSEATQRGTTVKLTALMQEILVLCLLLAEIRTACHPGPWLRVRYFKVCLPVSCLYCKLEIDCSNCIVMCILNIRAKGR